MIQQLRSLDETRRLDKAYLSRKDLAILGLRDELIALWESAKILVHSGEDLGPVEPEVIAQQFESRLEELERRLDALNAKARGVLVVQTRPSLNPEG